MRVLISLISLWPYLDRDSLNATDQHNRTRFIQMELLFSDQQSKSKRLAPEPDEDSRPPEATRRRITPVSDTHGPDDEQEKVMNGRETLERGAMENHELHENTNQVSNETLGLSLQ